MTDDEAAGFLEGLLTDGDVELTDDEAAALEHAIHVLRGEEPSIPGEPE